MIDYITLHAVNRPLVIPRGYKGMVESNMVNAFVGDWFVFKLPIAEGVEGELRLPYDEALEAGLIVEAERFAFSTIDEDEDGDDD